MEKEKKPDPMLVYMDDEKNRYGDKITRVQSIKKFKNDCKNIGGIFEKKLKDSLWCTINDVESIYIEEYVNNLKWMRNPLISNKTARFLMEEYPHQYGIMQITAKRDDLGRSWTRKNRTMNVVGFLDRTHVMKGKGKDNEVRIKFAPNRMKEYGIKDGEQLLTPIHKAIVGEASLSMKFPKPMKCIIMVDKTWQSSTFTDNRTNDDLQDVAVVISKCFLK